MLIARQRGKIDPNRRRPFAERELRPLDPGVLEDVPIPQHVDEPVVPVGLVREREAPRLAEERRILGPRQVIDRGGERAELLDHRPELDIRPVVLPVEEHRLACEVEMGIDRLRRTIAVGDQVQEIDPHQLRADPERALLAVEDPRHQAICSSIESRI